MFFSAESLELEADRDLIQGPQNGNARFAAYQFAAKWRHGMAGNSWLYMPGFFASALAAWHWALGQPARLLWMQVLPVSLSALLTAKLLAPAGTVLVIKTFEYSTGFLCAGTPAGPTLRGALVALYTLLTWCSVVIGSQLALCRRALRPLAVPVILNVVLALIRPWTVGDLSALWLQNVRAGEPVAIGSFLAILLSAALLVSHQTGIRQLGDEPGKAWPRITRNDDADS
jgi:hypothetical protein